MNKGIGIILAAMLLLAACQEEVDTSARYIFREKTITDYLDSHQEYREYMRLLSKTPVSRVSETTLRQLLSARGHYTVFAPTNEAIQHFLDTLYSEGLIAEPSWNGFSDKHKQDSIEKIVVYNSIIDGGDDNLFYTYDFPTRQDGEIPLSNMNDRKLVVHFPEDSMEVGAIQVCGARIDSRNRDIPLLNGVLHAVHAVVRPSDNTLGKLLFDIVEQKREGFYVSAQLVQAVGLLDSLQQYADHAYDEKYLRGELPVFVRPTAGTINDFYTPEHRYYGYTYFAETDSLWSALLGKEPMEITVDDVVSYLEAQGIYPDAVRNRDYESEDNLLNRFVTYHLLPERLTADRLVLHYNEVGYSLSEGRLGVPMSEYYTTMGKRRLLKLYESAESDGVWLNRFPILDNGRRGTYHEVSCEAGKEGIRIGATDLQGENSLRNGMLYPIDRLLLYDDQTRGNLMKERIRFDVASIFPEFINNDFRMYPLYDSKKENIYIPTTNEYPYLDGSYVSEQTTFFYWTGLGRGWPNYDGDELNIRGLQDVTFRLPPVPLRSTYEIRYAISNVGVMRGIVQFYWGKDVERLAPMGIPLDLRIGPLEVRTAKEIYPSKMGWEADTDDDDYNAEIDKRLRNNGFMKGAAVQLAGGPGSGTNARVSQNNSRRIIIRQTMDPDETYYIRFKTVMDDPTRYLYIDYLEYCAKEVYDNPEAPEDIW
ncbi:MAG: hypothetical protein IJR87_01825 [Bacteroidaceae bacterium]|nr:hypothetical protein [Bacteroidaceae bacterium]